MTIDAAIYEARKRIREKKLDHGFYIVWSPEIFDCPGHHYHIAEERELNTFFLGAPVAGYVESSGEAQVDLFAGN